MSVQLITNLGAILVVARHRDGRVLVLVDVDEPRRLILGMARLLLAHHERRELARVLLTH